MNNIDFSMTHKDLPGWTTLLSGGVTLERTVNLDMRTFITRELNIEDAYLNERIQTIFLNASPVDDVDTAIVRDGIELTLCSAMPGAMGICMRRDSPLKAYRPSITHCEDCEALVDPTPGRIHLKMFNFIAREQGATILGGSVVLDGPRLREHLESRDASFWNNVESVSLNGKAIAPEELGLLLGTPGEVRLTVKAV